MPGLDDNHFKLIEFGENRQITGPSLITIEDFL